MRVEWVGRRSYADAHARQVALRDDILAGKVENTLLLLEHDPVITFGRRGPGDDLIASRDEIERRGIRLEAAERGGQTTYHGPGQLVAYMVARLHDLAPDVPTLVWRIEEAMIRTAAALGVAAERCHCGHGVYVDDRKLGFIGIAVSRGVCWHGFALNVDLDLTPFGLIRPCGLDVEVTSIAAHARAPSVEAVGAIAARELAAVCDGRALTPTLSQRERGLA